jgi:hypothetical protein
MNNLKNLCAVVGVLIVVASLMPVLVPNTSHGQAVERGNSAPGTRKYYLTTTIHDGNEVLAACERGYRMASLWEIHDPTTLRYNNVLGFNRSDSGGGPPSGSFGWIRTGWDSEQEGFTGSNNCNAYTSDSPFGEGTEVALERVWAVAEGRVISPWSTTGGLCSEPSRVWCVQD